MSRYEIKHLIREPSGKDETTPFVMFGTVSASLKRHINRSIEKVRDVREKAAESMGLMEHLHRGALKRYCLLVLDELTPDEMDEKYKDEDGYKPFSKDDRAKFEAFPEEDRHNLGVWWSMREEFFHNHHAEICAILISSIHGSTDLINEQWSDEEWPQLTPRETESAIDQRATTLLFYLDKRDLDGMFEEANEHYSKAGLPNGQAKK